MKAKRMSERKWCTQCLELRPRREFWRNAGIKCGLDSWCKRCQRAKQKVYRRTDAGRAVAKRSGAKFRARHPGRVKAYLLRPDVKEARAEKRRVWRKTEDRTLEYRKYNAKRPGRGTRTPRTERQRRRRMMIRSARKLRAAILIADQQHAKRAWSTARGREVAVEIRRYRHRERYATPEGKAVVLAKKHRRRARKKVGVAGGLKAGDIRRIKDAHERCYLCKRKIRKAKHVDHWIPLAKGGLNEEWNIRIACGPCNMKKSAHSSA